MADQFTQAHPHKNRRPRRAVCQRLDRRLQLLNVGRLGTFLALSDIKADALILLEGTETLGLDRGVMDEEICSALLWGDESETLFGVEPLDGALLCHDCSLLVCLEGLML